MIAVIQLITLYQHSERNKEAATLAKYSSIMDYLG